MISKDAQSLAGFDLEQQKMRFFSLHPDGTCSEKDGTSLDRGDIGKIDFSPDASAIAFHFSDRSLQFSPLTFGIPEPSWQLRSTVFDFQSQTYRMLPFFGKGVQTYYPSFLPNGHLLVLKTTEENSEFLEIDVARLKPVSRQVIDRYLKMSSEEFASIRKLSQAWMEQCLIDPTRSERSSRVLSLFSLTREQCRELASKDHLEAVCEQLAD
jgi:hypothetical protein